MILLLPYLACSGIQRANSERDAVRNCERLLTLSEELCQNEEPINAGCGWLGGQVFTGFEPACSGPVQTCRSAIDAAETECTGEWHERDLALNADQCCEDAGDDDCLEVSLTCY